MEKIKKILNFIKNNYLYLLFVIPFIFVSFGNNIPNSDIWFVLTLGKYVFSNGVPSVDPFTIHEGLEYIMQQWGSASIMWKIYDIFGDSGILMMVYVVCFLLLIFLYKLCRENNKNKTISIVLTTLAVSIIGTHFVVMRPHIFSYLLFIIEILLLEKYVKSSNWKYLIGLPILSLISVNLHLSMWYFLFVFLLPFIANAIYIKNITIDKIKLLPLLVTMVLMFVVGFINPYGINGLSFVFRSYGIDMINEYIAEMQAPIIGNEFSIYYLISLGLIFALILCQRYLKKFKLDVRHICFVFGTYFLYVNHLKCLPYFILIYFYVMSYGFKDVKLRDIKFKYMEQLKVIVNRTVVILCVLLFVTFFYVSYLSFNNYSLEPDFSFNDDEVEIADFIEENYGTDSVRLYSTFDEGRYYLHRGFKVYIDGRAELFFKSHNGKADIFAEALEVEEDKIDYDYKSFIDKYNFTHIIIFDDCNFDNYLATDERYEKVYTTYLDSERQNPYRNIYALKSTEN